ncbi:Ureide permease 2 [Capsicum baccatum]|uniref:Ureide permease 2 n=1 Tax=Capsicum baccatum TaxID=33114 RepID=A0A2G2XQ30_CAPBA|nr:Ureide permease 2 [Capsicum baccatum]
MVQDNWPSVLFAMAGGVVLSLGNLATQYALAFVGLSVTEVVSASITVVIGTTVNYYLDDKINKAEILFPGVGCFLIAVFLGSGVHASNAADNKAKLESYSNESKDDIRGWALLAGLLCGFGNGVQFMGGQAAGYAAADAVQALPLVSTFWGIVLFGNYRRSSRKIYTLLVGMLSMFVAAVGVLMASAGQRK